MLDLFNRYLQNGKIIEALLVGQNMVTKTTNRECFEAYENLLFKLAKETDDFSMSLRYIRQAENALSCFAINAQMDEGLVEFLIEKQHQLDALHQSVNDGIAKKEEETLASKHQYNSDSLALIERLADRLLLLSDEAEFSKTLDQIKAIDKNIEKSCLTKDQEATYERLTKKCSDNVAAKMKEFEHSNNVQYNLQAAEAFEAAFNLYKIGKDADRHDEIIQAFFSFDPTRLFNETLIYYNHVYSFIFSKLSDEEKFSFTKIAIRYQKR